MRDHPEPADLVRLLAGDLEAAEADAVLRHLEECELCLLVADDLWGGVPALVGEEGEVSPMSELNVRHVEQRLFRRMHAASVGTQLTWLATSGFVRVIVVLLRPILGGTRSFDSQRGTR